MESNGQQNGQPRDGQHQPAESRIRAADRAASALALRRTGMDYRSIAAELGYTNPGSAHKAVQKALKDVIREPAREVREAELDRLDALLARVWPLADTENPDLKAVDRVLKLMERRAALLGLDAEKQGRVLQVNVTAEDLSAMTDEQLDELARRLAGRAN